MYYEKKKANPLGWIIIIFFLMIIVAILIRFMNKVEAEYVVDENDILSTGTETVLNEFNIENLFKNSVYSVVRNFKVE